MIKAMKWVALAGVAMAGLSAAPAQAREYIEQGYLKMENRAETKRKICIFGKEEWKIVPRKCFTLEPGEWVLWERQKPKERFRAVFYETRLGPDKLLKSLDLKKETVYLATTGVGGSIQSSWKPRPGPPKPEFRVKYCNTSQADPVWLVIGATSGQKAFTEGFWSISKGDCLTINYSERYQLIFGGDRGVPLRPMYRAYTVGENRLTWGGSREKEEPELCINTDKRFAIDQFDANVAANGGLYACDGEGEQQARFRWGPNLDEEVQVGRIDF
ncbi:MAG: hypothetical protein AAGK02_13340 [Pseudomonadota bacterium]